MELLELSLKKQIEYSYVFSRQRVLTAKQNTLDDIYFSYQLHKTVGDAISTPHLLYYYASLINDQCWFQCNHYTIISEKFSEADKIEMMRTDGIYDDAKSDLWLQYCDADRNELKRMIYKFEREVSDKWDVNSAARGLIDNMLSINWEITDHYMKDD